jgi:hypothetical protein
MAFRSDDQDSNTRARFPVSVEPILTTFTSVDGSNSKLIVSNPTSTLGYRLDSLLVSTDDEISNMATFYFHNGSSLSSIPFSHCPILDDSGVGGSRDAISVLRSANFEYFVSLDNNGNPFLMLGVGWSIYASLLYSPTVTKTVQFYALTHSY